MHSEEFFLLLTKTWRVKIKLSVIERSARIKMENSHIIAHYTRSMNVFMPILLEFICLY